MGGSELNDNGPHRLIDINVWFTIKELCDVELGGGVTLSVGFGISKAHVIHS